MIREIDPKAYLEDGLRLIKRIDEVMPLKPFVPATNLKPRRPKPVGR